MTPSGAFGDPCVGQGRDGQMRASGVTDEQQSGGREGIKQADQSLLHVADAIGQANAWHQSIFQIDDGGPGRRESCHHEPVVFRPPPHAWKGRRISARPSADFRAACRGRRARSPHHGLAKRASEAADVFRWRRIGNERRSHFCCRVAEGVGFEPTMRVTPHNGLASRRLQPLGHPSARALEASGVPF